MTFEKWQALGNDYVILEQEDLPFELTPAARGQLCAPHTGIGSDGVLLLSATDEPGFVAALRIFNPDGSEAELSGNGAREAMLYLRRHGWTDRHVLDHHRGGRDPARRSRARPPARVDMGRARARRLPGGGATARDARRRRRTLGASRHV